MKMKKPGRRKTGLEARKARKRAGLLLRGFVSSQFKDKRRREKLRKPKPGEAAEGWE